MLGKIQDWKFLFRNRVFRLHKSVPSTEKRPRKPGTGNKVGFEEMEHEFPFVTFRPEKQDYLLGCSVTPGIIVSAGTHDPKSRVPFTNRIFRKLL